MSVTLPTGYEALQPFAETWAGKSAAERAALRSTQSAEERAAFHAACTPLIKQGLEMLDRTPLQHHDEGQRALLNMFLAYGHVSLAIDVQSVDEDKHRPLRDAMHITRDVIPA